MKIIVVFISYHCGGGGDDGSLVVKSCPTLATPWTVARWTVAHQAPLCMGFSRQENWSGLPFPSPSYPCDGDYIR